MSAIATDPRFSRRLRARRLKDRLFANFCLGAMLFAVGLLFVLLVKIGIDGAPSLRLSFLTNFAATRPEQAGIAGPLVGSFVIMGVTALITMPIGIGAAIYLEEFNLRKTRFSRFVELNIANLAGVPSIVYGLLGLALFVYWLSLGKSVLSGALTMSLLILPMVILISQEALRAVPSSFREGSLALGATRWQTVRRQVLPAAAPGILTGIILSISRAIGETAPLIVVGAVGFANFLPTDLGARYTVLPIQIFDWTSRPQPGFKDAAAAAIVCLLAVLLALNSIAIFLRLRNQRSL